MTPPAPLPEQLLADLHELIELNVDSVNGFAEAATLTDDRDLAALFDGIAKARRRNVAALGEYFAHAGQRPDTAGTVKGATHRAWMDLRAFLQGNDRNAVLGEVVRGEATIKGKYESVIEATKSLPIGEILQEQYRDLVNEYDRIRVIEQASKEST